jgi:hypothetical protein
MCRRLAYSGDPSLLEAFLVEGSHSLIDQKAYARDPPTNCHSFRYCNWLVLSGRA